MTEPAVSIEDLEREVHVWLAHPKEIDDANRLDRYLDLLSEGERARHARFRFDVHRKLYLVSHALVRTTLSRYAAVRPNAWRFEEGEHGRPEIAAEHSDSRLRFNLSHTENLAACVVCLDRDCGVDVERVGRVKNLEGVARRVFTAPELADLEEREGDDLQGRFTDYWTLKEAYMKARGMGFQLPPDTFTVRLRDSSARRGHDVRLALAPDFGDRAQDWQLHLRAIRPADKPNYRLGLAIRTGGEAPLRVVVREIVP